MFIWILLASRAKRSIEPRTVMDMEIRTSAPHIGVFTERLMTPAVTFSRRQNGVSNSETEQGARGRTSQRRVTASPASVACLRRLTLACMITLLMAAAADAQTLILSPHPDDDVITAAGVIADARRRGETVTIVYLTNGDLARIPLAMPLA